MSEWIDSAAMWRHLLKKYMHFIVRSEGLTFVDHIAPDANDQDGLVFSTAELEQLQQIRDELSAQGIHMIDDHKWSRRRDVR